MAKSVLVPIADGSEEIEAICIIDILRRAGAQVTVASVDLDGALTITASRRTTLVADCHINDCLQQSFDLIAIPGGLPGAEHLRDCNSLTGLLQEHNAQGKWVAAICAAPALVFESHGLLTGKKATAHPGFVNQIKSGTPCPDTRVVIDGNCITSQAPGTAIEFSLELVRQLFGEDKCNEVAGPMVVSHPQ
ncbi:MAG: DJ-1 family protein [Halieaceae bacterium]|jgi:protein deglycase|nr:DJ-1 family protein [Halieaceae bacterium]